MIEKASQAAHQVGGLATTRVGYVTIAVAFGGFGMWAALAPLTPAAVAGGEVEVDSYHKTVQHREGGIVKTIQVKDGDRVTAGQTLMTLDDTEARVRWEQSQNQYWNDVTMQARLVAERDGVEEIDFGDQVKQSSYPKLAEMMRAETNLFHSRKRLVEGQIAVLEKKILQMNREADALTVEQRSKDRQLALIREQVGTVEQLLNKGLGLRPRLLQLKGEAERLEGERDDFGAKIAQVHQAIASTELEVTNVKYRYMQDVATSLRDVEGDMRAAEQEMAAAQDALKRTVLRAPQDGVVVGLKIHTPGGVVGSGEEIMDVVPERSELVVEARVKPEDIDRVAVGQPAQIRFLTFLPGVTPPAKGTVTQISADLFHDERNNQPYYLTRVLIDPESVHDLPGPLVPGMQTQVFVTGPSRSALAYIVDPLARAMAVAMREK